MSVIERLALQRFIRQAQRALLFVAKRTPWKLNALVTGCDRHCTVPIRISSGVTLEHANLDRRIPTYIIASSLEHEDDKRRSFLDCAGHGRIKFRSKRRLVQVNST
ncbi:hypothetical protein [Vreelandella rituensis]|nr:hypothetical protein [Halomonas rituensis]